MSGRLGLGVGALGISALFPQDPMFPEEKPKHPEGPRLGERKGWRRFLAFPGFLGCRHIGERVGRLGEQG